MIQKIADRVGDPDNQISVWYFEPGSVPPERPGRLGDDLEGFVRDPGAYIATYLDEHGESGFDQTWRVQLLTVNNETWKAGTVVGGIAMLFHSQQLALLVMQKNV